MGNLGGGEVLVLLMLGLLVLGPSRLAVVARRVGSMTREVRRVAGAFQDEVRDLVEDPSIEALARERGRHQHGSSGIHRCHRLDLERIQLEWPVGHHCVRARRLRRSRRRPRRMANS